MKLSRKQRRIIIIFLVLTVIGLISNPCGIALDVCFLIWELMQEDDE